MEGDKKEIPPTIMLSFLYHEIKRRNKGPIIKTKLLKEIIKIHLITKSNNPKNPIGGDRTGINKIYIYDIILDLINFSLIKKIDHANYEIVNDKKITSPIIRSILKKIEYLESIKFNKKKYIYKSRLEKINNILNELVDKLEEDTKFQIIKNNCEKRLKHYPF